MAEFRASVQFEAGRYRGAYPRTAYAAGQEGTVVVRVNVDEAGTRSVDVKTSSGYGNLDARALALIKVAAAAAKLPPAVQSAAFSVDVPVVFSLTRPKN